MFSSAEVPVTNSALTLCLGRPPVAERKLSPWLAVGIAPARNWQVCR